MALDKTCKLAWIVETIYQAKKITFEELNKKWEANVELSGGEELKKRTFHKWKEDIFNMFGLIIECEKGGSYYYHIVNAEDINNCSIENWLLSTCSVSNSLLECKTIKNRILLENVPSGREYLDPILSAMKENRFIHITYYNYWRGDEREHYVMPLCVKLFRQRWYMVGRVWSTNQDIIYCLDRIRAFRPSSHTFDFPKDFDPQDYFLGCFGIIADQDINIETVKLKVTTGQANYLRDLPLHESQREVERNDEYSIFKLRIRPTYDFIQELLWNNEELEVLEPHWLREYVAGIIERMRNKYKYNTAKDDGKRDN